jgi:hypothetical protein
VGTAVLEVTGPEAARWAAELHAALAANAGPDENVSPVEVQRSAEVTIAVIGLVFAGVGAAKTIWDWYSSRRTRGVSVTVLLSDGTRVDVSNLSEGQLEIVFSRSSRGNAESGEQRD